MRWPSWRGDQSGETEQEREGQRQAAENRYRAARHQLDEVQRRNPEVNSLISRLKKHQETNHLAEKIDRIFQGKHA